METTFSCGKQLILIEIVRVVFAVHAVVYYRTMVDVAGGALPASETMLGFGRPAEN